MGFLSNLFTKKKVNDTEGVSTQGLVVGLDEDDDYEVMTEKPFEMLASKEVGMPELEAIVTEEALDMLDAQNGKSTEVTTKKVMLSLTDEGKVVTQQGLQEQSKGVQERSTVTGLEQKAVVLHDPEDMVKTEELVMPEEFSKVAEFETFEEEIAQVEAKKLIESIEVKTEEFEAKTEELKVIDVEVEEDARRPVIVRADCIDKDVFAPKQPVILSLNSLDKETIISTPLLINPEMQETFSTSGLASFN